MVQNGQNDHFGQNDLIPNRILVFARPKWTILVQFGLKKSILVHLGPPTVLWSLLIIGSSRGNTIWGNKAHNSERISERVPGQNLSEPLRPVAPIPVAPSSFSDQVQGRRKGCQSSNPKLKLSKKLNRGSEKLGETALTL